MVVVPVSGRGKMHPHFIRGVDVLRRNEALIWSSTGWTFTSRLLPARWSHSIVGLYALQRGHTVHVRWKCFSFFFVAEFSHLFPWVSFSRFSTDFSSGCAQHRFSTSLSDHWGLLWIRVVFPWSFLHIEGFRCPESIACNEFCTYEKIASRVVGQIG